MLESTGLKSAIHWLSTVLETPAIIILLLMVAITLIELGSLIVEIIVERRKSRIDVTGMLENMQDKDRDAIVRMIDRSKFLKRKKNALKQLATKPLSKDTAEALAAKLIFDEESHSQRIVQVTDVIARIAPMFGLMATLIPLGPGLIALGRGDTQMLSESLLTAFDATVAGLAAAGVAYIISRVRKRWYESDLAAMETVAEGILAELYPNTVLPQTEAGEK